MPVPLHLLMMCHVLVRHRKHYNLCSLVCSEYSRKWRFRFNARKILHITVLTKPTREKPDI